MKFSPATHWLRTEHVNSNVSAMKNKSELLLEGYLRNHGESDFDFERRCLFPQVLSGRVQQRGRLLRLYFIATPFEGSS